MDVRRAETGDADAIADVFVASFESLDFLPRLHTPAEHRAHIRDVVLREQEVWVGEDGGGSVVGFAALAGDLLMHLYVHPDAQGRGVGAALLAQVKVQRPDGLSLWVFQQNESARRFYERHGLHVVRLTDGGGNAERTPDALYAWRPII